jgi:serine/threonine-protein kinase
VAGRFVPGTLLAQRFRIVGLVGKGGMGEVYRADDLKLGQTIALKFLPEQLQNDAERLARFYNEVRVARQITHPNVCRVHDVDELDGLHFLSMEYVDGENLASLLRRIGRLPRDKALEIARQLCAGLAAAHDRDVLHRDLKPENVMIDGRGQVRITDFGLASVADAVQGADVRSGTPAYMAPEQLSGQAVTARSDLYALGLVLYEVFTGKHAFDGRPLAERVSGRGDSTPTLPSAVVEDIDPAVERVILHCLERDAARRPGSARAIVAALPGGDPLAAALAAGETPSPEMVAAGGETGALRPGPAWACLGAMVATLALALLIWPQRTLLGHLALEKPPAALEERAKEVLRAAGYEARPADEARSFDLDDDFIRYLEAKVLPIERWAVASAGPTLQFWYRQSPRPMHTSRLNGTVTAEQPAPVDSGMTGVRLDSRGRLLSFYAVPPQVEDSAGATTGDADWTALLAAAGLEHLTPAEPRWLPPTFSDHRSAWEGAHPNVPGASLRVEAASYRGRPVYFQTVAPWTRPDRMQPFELTPGLKTANMIGLILGLAVVVSSGLLARHNTHLGRADRKGAFRVARYTFGSMLATWALTAHHVPELFDEMGMVVRALGFALLLGAMLWLFYTALEPYVRRHWPERIVAWSRLLSGRFKDPLVGRDVLIGVLCGASAMLLAGLLRWGLERLGRPVIQMASSPDVLLGMRELASSLLIVQLNALLSGMFLLLFLLLLRSVLRRDWLAAVVFAGFNGVQNCLVLDTGGAVTLLVFVFTFGVSLILVGVIVRLGLLAASVTVLFEQLLSVLPLSADPSSPYAGTTLVFLLITLGLGIWGFRTSLAGQSAFGGELFRD